MKIDKTLHPLAKYLTEKCATKEDYYKLISLIDEWYLKQLDAWMTWIREIDADKTQIVRKMDEIAMPLRIQVPDDIKNTNPEWEDAWNYTHQYREGE